MSFGQYLSSLIDGGLDVQKYRPSYEKGLKVAL